MSTQTEFNFEAQINEEEPRENNPNGADLYAEARRWMDENPRIYDLFVRFAKELVAQNRRFGIGLLAERVRWECLFLYGGEFKVNNNYRAYIARRLVRDVPGVERLITFRRVRYGPDQE